MSEPRDDYQHVINRKGQHTFRICPCEGECRCMTEEAAVASSAAMLRERYEGQRCDSAAVSCCVRCNVMYLVKAAERAVEGRLRYVQEGAQSGSQGGSDV